MKSEGRPSISPQGDDPAQERATERVPSRLMARVEDDERGAPGRKAFVPREAALAGSPDLVPGSSVAEPMDIPRPSLRLPLLAAGTGVALWLGFCIAAMAGVIPWRFEVADMAALMLLVLPVLLVAVLVMQMVVIRRTTGGSLRATRQAGETILAAQQSIEDGHERLRHSAQSTATLADQAARAMSLAADAMGGHQSRIAEELDRTLVQIDALAEKLDAMTRSAPRIEDRLAKLTQVVARSADELGDRGSALEQQFRTTATVSEEARRKLIEANRSLSAQLATLQEGTRSAGEELAGMSELASARIDLTMDRMRSVLDATDERIERQTQALVRMGEEHEARTIRFGGEALERMRAETAEMGERIDEVAARLSGGQVQMRGWLSAMSQEIADLAASLVSLEGGATIHGERIRDAVDRLTADTQRMAANLLTSGTDADALVRKAETLLLALDSGIRELDESLPAAFDRVDGRLTGLQQAIAATLPSIESMEAAASGVASRVEEADRAAQAHARELEAGFGGALAALESREQALARLVEAMAAARTELQAFGDRPDQTVLDMLAQVNDTADAAAQKVRAVISAIIPEAVEQLGRASEDAIAKSVAGSLAVQLDQLAVLSDNAVKAAHRATDKLNRQMLSLSDSSAQMEQRIRVAAELVEQQNRDYLAARSVKLIGALNSRAIDVSKWLDRDITQPEWNAYLKGDQSLFARRAARLVSHADGRAIQSMFENDAEFAEHVSRYIQDFEALLRSMLGAVDGSSLAVTMLSSDIGKLYVALAQATERLRD